MCRPRLAAELLGLTPAWTSRVAKCGSVCGGTDTNSVSVGDVVSCLIAPTWAASSGESSGNDVVLLSLSKWSMALFFSFTGRPVRQKLLTGVSRVGD